MSACSMSIACIPYAPLRAFLQSTFEKFQERQLADLIQTSACAIGSIDNSRITVWAKKDCTVEKIRTCSYLRLYQAALNEVPAPIRQLKNLHTIDFAGNRLKRLPRWIGELSHLRELNLGRNRITTFPDEMIGLHNLQMLSLYDNQLDAIPSQLFRIKSLQKLYLDDNKIKTLSPKIGQLTNLKILSLVRNGLVTIPKELKELKSLRTLCCRYDNTLNEASMKIAKELGKIVQG